MQAFIRFINGRGGTGVLLVLIVLALVIGLTHAH